MNLRETQKARTHQRILEVAQRLFSENPYEAVTMRGIAGELGMSTGAVVHKYPSKAELWWAAMGTPPPMDSALTRHAVSIEKALRELVRLHERDDPSRPAWARAWQAADAALDAVDAKVGAGAPVTEPPPAAPSEATARSGFSLDPIVRDRLVRDVLEEAERAGWRPVSQKGTAAVVREAVHRVTRRRVRAATDLDVYSGAVKAAAQLLVVAVRGVIEDEDPRAPNPRPE